MSSAVDVTLAEDAVELSHSAAYERYLLFDRAADPRGASARDRFEAFARSVRDALAERWALTTRAYERHNPKMVYYLSMELLIGCSLANNVTNLELDQIAQRAISKKDLDWLALLEQEPDPGLGNGGLGRLAACFLDSMATLQLPAMGYGLNIAASGRFSSDRTIRDYATEIWGAQPCPVPTAPGHPLSGI